MRGPSCARIGSAQSRNGCRMSTKKREQPALASAKRAIHRVLAQLTPAQVFHAAAYLEILHTGEDRGRWALSASYAASQEEPYRWKCDAPDVTKGGRDGER